MSEAFTGRADNGEYYVDGRLWAVAGAMALGRPICEVAEQYFSADATGDTWHIAAGLAAKYKQNATDAYRVFDDPALVAGAPVAAHQEMDFIGPSLECYADQNPSMTHRINLLCNAPAGASKDDVSQTLKEISDFQRRHREVPLAYTMVEVDKSVTIGKLRKWLFDSALFHLLQSERTDDVLVLNHDADITGQNAGHFDRMFDGWHNAESPLPVTVVAPRLRHQRSGGRLPNMDSVVAWEDTKTMLMHGYFEMGVGLSARAMFAAGGVDPARRRATILDLIERMYRPLPYHPGFWFVPDAHIETAARRLYAHLAANRREQDFWHDPPTPQDTFRTQVTDNFTDIDELTRDHKIAEVITERRYGYSLFDYMVQRGRQRLGDGPQAYDYAERALLFLQQYILGGDLSMTAGELLSA